MKLTMGLNARRSNYYKSFSSSPTVAVGELESKPNRNKLLWLVPCDYDI